MLNAFNFFVVLGVLWLNSLIQMFIHILQLGLEVTLQLRPLNLECGRQKSILYREGIGMQVYIFDLIIKCICVNKQGVYTLIDSIFVPVRMTSVHSVCPN